METAADMESDGSSSQRIGGSTAQVITPSLPTQPCSVVWSMGHAYVLERTTTGAVRWVGVNDRGRPEVLTHRELDRRGWTLAS